MLLGNESNNKGLAVAFATHHRLQAQKCSSKLQTRQTWFCALIQVCSKDSDKTKKTSSIQPPVKVKHRAAHKSFGKVEYCFVRHADSLNRKVDQPTTISVFVCLLVCLFFCLCFVQEEWLGLTQMPSEVIASNVILHSNHPTSSLICVRSC